MASPESVAIVDDDALFRKALERVFRSAGFAVESYADAETFLTTYMPKSDGCIVLDLRMPFVGGLEVQEHLVRRGIDLPVIIYTGNADVQVTVRAMQAGAFTVLEKPQSNELLIEQVRTAIARTRPRRTYRCKVALARARLGLLTERERETARHLAMGMSAPEIGRLLGISPRTVEAHRTNLFRKLEIRSGAELAQLLVYSDQDVS